MSTFYKGMVVYVVLAIVFMAIAYNAGYAKGKSGGSSIFARHDTPPAAAAAGGVELPKPPASSTSFYIGSWVSRSGFGDSRVTFNDDGNGSGSGFVFSGPGETFTWREDGDHIAIENWNGGQKDHFTYGKIAPDGKGLYLKGVGIYENFSKE